MLRMQLTRLARQPDSDYVFHIEPRTHMRRVRCVIHRRRAGPDLALRLLTWLLPLGESPDFEPRGTAAPDLALRAERTPELDSRKSALIALLPR